MIFFLFVLSLVVIQRIVSTAAETPKLKLPQPPVSEPLRSPDTSEYQLSTSLLSLSQAIEQSAPSTTATATVKNTAQ